MMLSLRVIETSSCSAAKKQHAATTLDSTFPSLPAVLRSRAMPSDETFGSGTFFLREPEPARDIPG